MNEQSRGLVPELSVVLPCFNERENLPPLVERLRPVLERITGGRFEVIFVDDASDDGSERMLDALHAEDPRIKVVHFSRNFGHQAALTAGMQAASAEGVVLMDCDLQDPPEVLEAFRDRWREGYEVVYGVRRKRKEGLAKRIAYAVFYRSMRAMARIEVPLDAGDFCLMDRVVVDALNDLPESQRFLRGLRSWVGFRQTGVEYERSGRHAGEPKYTPRKLVQLAMSGYVGFSAFPLRLASWLGGFAGATGFLILLWAVVSKMLGDPAPRGWASTIAVILFMGGVQLLILGIIGEYLGRVFDEARRRPTYIVRSRLGFDAPVREAGTGRRAAQR